MERRKRPSVRCLLPTEPLDESISARIVIQDNPEVLDLLRWTTIGEGEKAIAALNGATIDGRALKINEARPKTDRGGAGGGDGFRRKRW